MPRDLVLAVGEREAGEPAHVLGSRREVGANILGRHPFAEGRQPGRSERALGLEPSATGRCVRRRREVGRDGEIAGHGYGLPYFATFFSCSAWVFAKALVPDPSPFAMKNR